jgi:hypothetical protein
MIFIAGNEPFTQGEIPYSAACALAREKGVVVNTIFCGSYTEGIHTSWKAGAEITGGSYMSIEQDRRTVYIATPYDARIDALNDELNKTYVYYGSEGRSKKELQSAQDRNAEAYGQANKVERAISKSSHAYKNSTWDLVDAAKENEEVVVQTKPEQLPAEMRSMSAEQRKAYVKEKGAERSRIQKEISTLSSKRQEYILHNTPKAKTEGMLDQALMDAIKQQAKTKNLSW